VTSNTALLNIDSYNVSKELVLPVLFKNLKRNTTQY